MKSLREQRNEQFYSYIAVQEKEKRTCLKCRRGFKSESAGHRICAKCQYSNQTIGQMGSII